MKKFLALILAMATVIGITVFSYAATLLGDVDKNGKVNSSDALMILQYSVGQLKSIDKTIADTTGDGKVNSSDALMVLQISVGQIEGGTVKDSTTKKTTTTTKKTTTTTKKTTTTTKKTTTTTKKTTTTTKKTTTTTKKTTTKTYSCPYEVTPGTSVKLPSGLNAAHKRSWLVSKSGLDIRISRLEYGKVTQTFDSNLSSQIVNPKKITYAPACTIAVITVDKPTRLAVSKGTQKKSTPENAKAAGAVLAIDGTKTAYSTNSAAIIRSGALYKEFTGTKAKRPQLVMYKDGHWAFKPLTTEAAKTEIKNGAYNSLSLQDITIQDGKIVTTLKDNPYRNRTFLGQISETKFVFMVTEVMPIQSAAEIMLKYGVKNAAQICGGNCTYMYLQGVGNSTNSTGASIKGLDKLGYLETEWFAKNGLLEAKKGGGPCSDELDCIYVK